MTEQLWSVQYLIGYHERVALDYAGTRVVGPHDYMVVQPAEGQEGPSTLHVDVRAATPEVAQERALKLYQRIREVAELPPEDNPQVVTIGRVAGVPRPADLFIFTADEMLDQQQFGLAVVSAQIHCEMSIRAAVEEAARLQGTPIAELAISLPGSWTLMDRHGPRIFETLLGVRPADAPCWESYRAHVARRNAVAHRGAPVTRELADASIDAAVAMVRFVEQALAQVRRRADEEQSGSS
jgi:hypothetical protein